MSFASWRCVFYVFVFSLVAPFLDIRTGATLEGSSMGYLPYAQEPVAFPRIARISDVKASHEGHKVVSRQKRNILFPSGVKLCAQETLEQVAANHLSYFHLRVCQETIWEAFKIFWDRLPEQEEYQSWMSQCQEGSVTAKDIGSYFSQSEEHQTLVKQRMSLQGLKSEPTRSWQHMCSTPTPRTREAVDAPELEDTAKEEEAEEAAEILPEVEDDPLDNDIAVEPPTPAAVLEQVVELSILLTGETYNDDLDNPASFQYQTLSRQLAEKIEDALQKLPGFKSVSVIDFRVDGVIVDYAVTVVVDGAGVSNEQLDYLTLQSNRVESSYREIAEQSTVVYTISEVKNVLTEALHNDEQESVSEIPESVNAADEAVVAAVDEPLEDLTLEEDIDDYVLPQLSETNTVATAENDVTVLEESEPLPPTTVLTTVAPEAGSIEEEGLLLEDTVQTPAAENPPNEELPAELPTPEQPESAILPEPPVETEASGSGPNDLEILLEPSTTTAEGVEEGEAEEAPLEETTSENVLITEEVGINTDVTSEAEGVEVEVAAVEEEPTTAALDKELLEEVLNEVEIPEDLEISTITTETIEEEVLPAQVPLPEVLETASEAPEPESTEAVLIPVDSVETVPEESIISDVPPADEEVNSNHPEEDSASDMVLTNPAVPSSEEDVVEEAKDSEVKEETAPEAPVVEVEVEVEATKAPEISTEDLTEDEILLVDTYKPELPITDVPNPAQPTALSPEIESPFTRISDISPDPEEHPDIIIPALVEIQTTNDGLDDATIGDHGFGVVHYGYGPINHTEEGSTGFPIGISHGTDQASIAMPVNPGRALMVFFSLRVTNMIFSEDLFNKSSPEYKALEQRFLELLVPYLQSNLSHFENLEILNFRNGSIVVNSRMKFGRPVAQGVTTTVYLILEDFCNTAYQTMNLAIDKYSLDVESGDQADPCKFQACNEYAECKVNKWSGEAECVCNAGYFSVDGLPCQSICELQTDFCLNDGKCDIIPGQGAICRCRVGENWWYRGEHCEEYVSEPLVVGIAIASVAGFLLVASGVIFFLARTLRDQYDKDESEDPIRRAESLPSLERATKYNPMYESEATTGYSHYYRRYPEAPVYSSASAEASTDFSSDEIRHIYENSELTKEEIQDRIRIIELYAKDRQFADFIRHHQAVLDTRRESSSTQT
ncbi:interphotoreceptor matrix proteoglycan 2 isoform X2 [Amphiprion ocellaris]|uniref:Interphotoreceptor matrix proteoglycan 2 n=1 Tax=Amphiprion ocellaris TaxID=80972 RepID=A0AAQ5XQC5_AMPOC|nr:interphotoreceptor matrix proteoglycan 2 isoform X2 [Amphiprion ocellaris]